MKRSGQSSLETAIAMLAAILLFVGSISVFFWINHRLIKRQQDYEGEGGRERVRAANVRSGVPLNQRMIWNNSASRIRLRMFKAGNAGNTSP